MSMKLTDEEWARFQEGQEERIATAEARIRKNREALKPPMRLESRLTAKPIRVIDTAIRWMGWKR